MPSKLFIQIIPFNKHILLIWTLVYRVYRVAKHILDVPALCHVVAISFVHMLMKGNIDQRSLDIFIHVYSKSFFSRN